MTFFVYLIVYDGVAKYLFDEHRWRLEEEHFRKPSEFTNEDIYRCEINGNPSIKKIAYQYNDWYEVA